MNQKKLQKSAVSNGQPMAEYSYLREVRLVDTDATGMAHFASYVRMMEETEYAFLRSRGLSVVLNDVRGKMGFPRIRCQLQIERPLQLGEIVNVNVRLVKTDGKRVFYDFRITDADKSVAVTGQIVAALCRFPAGKPPYAILFPPGLDQRLTGKAQ